MTCRCDGSGKIPLLRQDGTVVPYAWTFCSCRQEHEHIRNVEPSDIDFNVSFEVYRSLCLQHGWPDPGADIPSPKLDIPQPVFRPRPVDREIDELKGKVNYLQNKVNHFYDKKKKQYEEYT